MVEDCGLLPWPRSMAMEAVSDTVVLYYKYVRVDDIEQLRRDQLALATQLGLRGRVLLGNEGVNGTLSGPASQVNSYMRAMDSHPLFGGIDWKLSSAGDGELSSERPFGDLLVKVVKELVSTGGAVALEDVAKYGGKHLAPAEFHAALADPNAVVLDVRNTFESTIGRFAGAERVPMTSFSEYAAWAESRLPQLRAAPKVLMYCTGGIRCEKASALLRKRGVDNVCQLDGGIHRYLEAFPDDGGRFKGKNFVFDRRMSQCAPGQQQQLGRCLECSAPHDTYSPRQICCVCKELVLVCSQCDTPEQLPARQYHCAAHRWLRTCYFRLLQPFTAAQLRVQAAELEQQLAEVVVEQKLPRGDGKQTQEPLPPPPQHGGGKNRRKTLRKQLGRVNARLVELETPSVKQLRKRTRGDEAVQPQVVDPQAWADAPGCVACGDVSGKCDGACWGVWASAEAGHLGAKAQDPATGDWIGRKHVLGNLTAGRSRPSISAALARRVEELLAVGCVVRRGPDWRWGRQDGGGGDETYGCDGKVTEVNVAVVVSGGGGSDDEVPNVTSLPSGVVRVHWQKTGLSELYTCGGEAQMYDVLPVAVLPQTLDDATDPHLDGRKKRVRENRADERMRLRVLAS